MGCYYALRTQGSDFNTTYESRGPDPCSILEEEIQKGNFALVKNLCQEHIKGASEEDLDWFSAMKKAIEYNHLALAEYILKTFNYKVDSDIIAMVVAKCVENCSCKDQNLDHLEVEDMCFLKEKPAPVSCKHYEPSTVFFKHLYSEQRPMRFLTEKYALFHAGTPFKFTTLRQTSMNNNRLSNTDDSSNFSFVDGRQDLGKSGTVLIRSKSSKRSQQIKVRIPAMLRAKTGSELVKPSIHARKISKWKSDPTVQDLENINFHELSMSLTAGDAYAPKPCMYRAGDMNTSFAWMGTRFTSKGNDNGRDSSNWSQVVDLWAKKTHMHLSPPETKNLGSGSENEDSLSNSEEEIICLNMTTITTPSALPVISSSECSVAFPWTFASPNFRQRHLIAPRISEMSTMSEEPVLGLQEKLIHAVENQKLEMVCGLCNQGATGMEIAVAFAIAKAKGFNEIADELMLGKLRPKKLVKQLRDISVSLGPPASKICDDSWKIIAVMCTLNAPDPPLSTRRKKGQVFFSSSSL